jgi:small subunit ribosomal protein S15e
MHFLIHFIFRGQLAKLFTARIRRRLSRGLQKKHRSLLARLVKAKKTAKELEKPACIKTHLRNMIILPEMVGCVVGIHNGRAYNQVTIFKCFPANI